jgi:hypothetical protein
MMARQRGKTGREMLHSFHPASMQTAAFVTKQIRLNKFTNT